MAETVESIESMIKLDVGELKVMSIEIIRYFMIVLELRANYAGFKEEI